jgi:hypothetical protein
MAMRKFNLLFVSLLFACEEKIDLEIVSENTGLVVVEGMLTNERKSHLVRLTLPYQQQNTAPAPASGATVRVIEDNVVYALNEEPIGSGLYHTPQMRAVVGSKYILSIQYEGKAYFAEDSAVPVQPLQSLSYIQDNAGYSLSLTPSGVDPNYIEHAVNWASTSTCVATTDCETKIMFYDLKTVDVNELFKPSKEEFHFPKQSSIVRRKYSISTAYREFLRAMLSETEWRGGVFDVQRADVPTNLSKGAIGFFAVCSVVSDSTIVQ